MDFPKLFTVGPVYVREEILAEMSMQMFSHRSEEYAIGHGAVIKKLQELMQTKNDIFLYTSSATGVMESVARNCIKKKVLNCVNGSFSKRFHEVCVHNEKATKVLEKELGQAILPEELDSALAEDDYDAVTIVHNETSTGVMNPLEKLCKVAKSYGVMLLVDTVSSMGGVEIDVDKLGIDVCLFSVQKCIGVPPGLAVASVSKNALEKSKEIEHKGYYFNFSIIKKYAEKHNTPVTPPIPQIFALNKQLDLMFMEGMENIWKRHNEVSKFIRNSCIELGYSVFPDENYLSCTMNCLKAKNPIEIVKELKRLGYIIANGHGKLKESTFRIGNMGNVYMDDAQSLIDALAKISI